MFSYNGLGRIAGQSGGPGGGGPGGGGNVMFGGNTGIFRLLQTGLGDQAGWLLGFALVAGLAVLVSTRLRRTDPRTGWLIAVGGAFLTTAIVFSFASGIFHPYYVSFLAPFTAALIGAGVGQALSGGRSARIVAPLAIGAGAVTELVVLGTVGGQLSWAKPLVIAVAAVCAVALAFALAPRVRWVVLDRGAGGPVRRAGHLGGRDPRPRHQQHVPHRRSRPAPRPAVSAGPPARRARFRRFPAVASVRLRPGRPDAAPGRRRRGSAESVRLGQQRLLRLGSGSSPGGGSAPGGVRRRGAFGGGGPVASAATAPASTPPSSTPRPTAAAPSASPARAALRRRSCPLTPTWPGWAGSPEGRARSRRRG